MRAIRRRQEMCAGRASSRAKANLFASRAARSRITGLKQGRGLDVKPTGSPPHDPAPGAKTFRAQPRFDPLARHAVARRHAHVQHRRRRTPEVTLARSTSSASRCSSRRPRVLPQNRFRSSPSAASTGPAAVLCAAHGLATTGNKVESVRRPELTGPHCYTWTASFSTLQIADSHQASTRKTCSRPRRVSRC